MTAETGAAAFARERGLEEIGAEDFRELTPALVTGAGGGIPWAVRGRLAEGLEGTLCHHVSTAGGGRRLQTVVVTRVEGSAAFMPALVCRDRKELGGAPARLPAEEWEATELESAGFNGRYLLMTLRGQDAGFVRELFSPSLIAWLADVPPPGFAFELNKGNLAVLVPGHLSDSGELAALCDLAREVTDRIAAEADEEDEDPDLFDESAKLRDIERGLADLSFDAPPESVMAAIAAAKRRTMRKPSVWVAAIGWGLGALVVLTVLVAVVGLIAGASLLPEIVDAVPVSAAAIAAAVLVAVLAIPALWLGLLIARGRYRWGSASVGRVGLEAFARGYASSRSLSLEDRWRFHAEHRSVPLPGFADHVFAGEIPGGEGVRGRLLMLADDAELRSRAQEVAFTAERPLAATALLVEAAEPLPSDVASRVEAADGHRLQVAGRHILVWRPVSGNLLRTAAGTDRFCASAAATVRQALAAEAPVV